MGEKHGQRRLTLEEIQEIRKRSFSLQESQSDRALARAFGVSPRTVAYARRVPPDRRKVHVLAEDDLLLAWSFYRECQAHRRVEAFIRKESRTEREAKRRIQALFPNHTHLGLRRLANFYGVSKAYLSRKFRMLGGEVSEDGEETE